MFSTTIWRSMRKHEPMSWVPSWFLIFSMFMYVFNVCIINLFWAVRWTWSNWCHVWHEFYGPLGPLGPSITEAALSLPHLPKTSASRGPWVAYRFSFSWSFSVCRLDEDFAILYMFFFATPCDLDLDSRCDMLLELFEILKWYNCRISCHTIANCAGQANVAASCEWKSPGTQSVLGYLVPKRFQARKCLWFAILYCYPAVISHGTDWTAPFIMDTLW